MKTSDPTDDWFVALGKVLDGYADLLAVARHLASFALAAGGKLRPTDFELHVRKFDTVDAQISYLRSLLAQGLVRPPS
ncbi:hypothetical protein HY634_04390 [Candidatus Uhrbacteria bacterium]|nr:hypothetical protein [Candidatus Uhrbacteria bacterium]